MIAILHYIDIISYVYLHHDANEQLLQTTVAFGQYGLWTGCGWHDALHVSAFQCLHLAHLHQHIAVGS
jgi:hypothetical protein